MDDSVPGGVRPSESIRIAQLLDQDGHLDAHELTRRQLTAKPDALIPRRKKSPR
jgi:hypothetical protein